MLKAGRQCSMLIVGKYGDIFSTSAKGEIALRVVLLIITLEAPKPNYSYFKW